MELTTGLKLHCDACGIVIPSDAPVPPGAGDCAFVKLHRLAGPFNPEETPAGQHAQAVAAWSLIYFDALRAGDVEALADGAARVYLRSFQRERKAHFAASAVRLAMTPEAVQAAHAHRRDRTLFV